MVAFNLLVSEIDINTWKGTNAWNLVIAQGTAANARMGAREVRTGGRCCRGCWGEVLWLR